MEAKYEALFTPWKIGNVEIKNRIVITSIYLELIFELQAKRQAPVHNLCYH